MTLLTRISVFIAILLCLQIDAKAAHIIGGEMTYECVGGNDYKITMHAYKNRDLGATLSGTAYFYVVDLDDMSIHETIAINRIDFGVLPTNDIGCIIDMPVFVIQDGHWEVFFNLPVNNNGYSIVFQNCCRTIELTNIVDFGQYTSTFELMITRDGLLNCNSGPQYNEKPPFLICNGFPFAYDHGATDAEGDDIRFSFCSPLDGQLSIACQRNPCPNTTTDDLERPPFPEVPFDVGNGYTESFPFGVSDPDPIRINPNTGLIQGTETVLGVYQLAVCMEEYRDGVLLSSTRREFQLTNADCQIMSANYSYNILDTCRREVEFFDNSVGASNIVWDFGDGSPQIMNDPNPLHIFGETGSFEVMMIAEEDGINCIDTFTQTVTVTSGTVASFDTDTICVGEEYQFSNTSFSADGDITGFEWIIEGVSYFDEEPLVTFNNPGNVSVQLFVETDSGCSGSADIAMAVWDSIVPLITVPDFSCTGEDVGFDNQSTGTVESVLWDFGDGGTSTDFAPSYAYNNPGQYDITVLLSNNACGSVTGSGTTSVNQAPFIGIGDSRDICEGQIDSFSIDTVGLSINSILWSTGDTTPKTYVQGGVTGLGVTITTNGCEVSDSIEITSECNVNFPTAFLPGGVNNEFNVIDQNVVSYELRVYNRWGEELFVTSDFDRGWDGTHNGVDAEMDVYVYIIEGQKIGGGQFKQTGPIMLIR